MSCIRERGNRLPHPLICSHLFDLELIRYDIFCFLGFFFSFFSCQGWSRVCSFPLPRVIHALSSVQIGLYIFIDSIWHPELSLALVLRPCCHIIKQAGSKFHVLFCEEHCFLLHLMMYVSSFQDSHTFCLTSTSFISPSCWFIERTGMRDSAEPSMD